MKSTANKICDLMPDYHSFNGFKFTCDNVIEWVNQFSEADRQFILEEFLHLLNQKVYLSEKEVRNILINKVNRMAGHYGEKNPITFLRNAEFLRMQNDENSQGVLLGMLDGEIKNNYGISLNECGSMSKKYVVYLDDVLATNRTVHDDCKKWLEEKVNLDDILKGRKILIISLFCNHTWGAEKLKWRLMKDLNNDAVGAKIHIRSPYKIENHPTLLNQRFNFAYPIKDNQPASVLNYFDDSHPSNYLRLAQYDEKYAFRPTNKPVKETFFSSPANRVRFENILISKGIDILNHSLNLQVNQRPLGMTNPTKKTFGTGTLFFTWRNISNTTPIVFWWKSDYWKYPLFELINRGN